ncbi:MAG: hypothetical protein ACOYOJ_11625 [Alsobacter sp.]
MLLRRPDLDAAVAAAIITRTQADTLEAFAMGRAGRPHTSDERFVVVNNFAEVFVSIGIMILIAAALVTLRQAPSGTPQIAVSGGMAVLAWLLAEFFVFRRRMMAPSIVSVLAVGFFVGTAVSLARHGSTDLWTAAEVQAAALVALGLGLVRFRVPFLVLPLAASLAFLAVDRTGGPFLFVMAGCGLVFLAVAVMFDLRDPARVKRDSQFAFWLYVAGSPLLVHPLFWTVLSAVRDGIRGDNVLMALAIGVVAAIVTTFGLLLDRRSPVISTLVYVAFAVGVVLTRLAGSAVALGLTLAVIGCYVIVLGVGWRAVRAAVLSRLPLGGLRAKLPPVN